MSLRACLWFLLFLSTCCSGAEPVFTGAGSSAAQPLYVRMAAAYEKTLGVRLDYQAVGSSAGIARIRERAVDFGASDVAMHDADLNRAKLICFPSAISGVVVVVNLPGIRGGDVKLTGELVADIFSRKIRNWNDAALAALNPHLHLPNLPITVVVRQDGSGTTYNFTDYLAQVSAEWARHYGHDFKIAWPAESVAVKGSGEVAKTVAQTRGAIAYIDYQYVLQDRLVYARLRNRDGRFVAPSAESFAAALQNSDWKTSANYEEMLTNKPGISSWPIAMGTFVLVPRVVENPERTIAALKFFSWGFVHGDALVESTNFVRLPEKVQGRIFAEMTRITDRNGRPLHWSLASLIEAAP